MKLKVGMNNGFLARWYPSPEDWVELVAGDFECDVVQFSWDLLDLSTPEEIASSICAQTRDAAKEHSVEIETTFTGHTSLTHNLLLHPDVTMRQSARLWFEKMVMLTSTMGAVATGGHIGTFSLKDVNDQSRRDEIEKDLQINMEIIAETAAKERLDYLLVEPSPNPHFMPSDPEHAFNWLDKTNRGKKLPVLLCPDTMHLVKYRGPGEFEKDLYEALELLAPVSPAVHVRQTDGSPGTSWLFTEESNRKGAVDGSRVIESLERGGAGDVSLLLEPMMRGPPKPEFIKEVRDSVRYWKEYV